MATPVERHSRYAMLIKVANKDTGGVLSALIKHSQKLPCELYRSLTWDRGKEVAGHQRLTQTTDVVVYFCDPRSPWQRGFNENPPDPAEKFAECVAAIGRTHRPKPGVWQPYHYALATMELTEAFATAVPCRRQMHGHAP